MCQFWVNRSKSTLTHSYPFLLSKNSKNQKNQWLVLTPFFSWHNFKNEYYWGPICGLNTLFLGHVPAKNKRFCLQKYILLNWSFPLKLSGCCRNGFWPVILFLLSVQKGKSQKDAVFTTAKKNKNRCCSIKIWAKLVE